MDLITIERELYSKLTRVRIKGKTATIKEDFDFGNEF